MYTIFNYRTAIILQILKTHYSSISKKQNLLTPLQLNTQLNTQLTTQLTTQQTMQQTP